MSAKWYVVIIVLIIVGISYCVYHVTEKKAEKNVAAYYMERQKTLNEINDFLNGQNKPSGK